VNGSSGPIGKRIGSIHLCWRDRLPWWTESTNWGSSGRRVVVFLTGVKRSGGLPTRLPLGPREPESGPLFVPTQRNVVAQLLEG
jgi:hypothetical protein